MTRFPRQVQAVLDEMAGWAPRQAESPSVAELRAFYHRFIPLMGEPEPVMAVEDREIPGAAGPIRIRIYRPAPGLRPAAVYFHGGWFSRGDLETHDRLVRALANASQWVMIAVDYRLAPEAPFPAAPDDAYAATVWVAENARMLGVDSECLAVIGDSAGGTLAAVVARRARERNGPGLVFQALMYPPLDASLNTPSWQTFEDGPLITRARAEWAWNAYIPHKVNRNHPDASPLRTKDAQGLPPALVITAECDPLRDEGEAYARILAQAGVPVQLSRYPGMIHGFVHMAGRIDAGRAAIAELAASLNAIRNGCVLCQ